MNDYTSTGEVNPHVDSVFEVSPNYAKLSTKLSSNAYATAVRHAAHRSSFLSSSLPSSPHAFSDAPSSTSAALSIKRSDAQPKKHFQWQIAQTLFAQHPQYAEAFSKALTGKAKDQKPRWCKIKNRVKM
ncbi:hypothetical protein B0H10DRAFT_1951552 [Mycena sp. CBHHK59/15]|nr:hypothetical protein B0H10DRAFT_1951552 [Mycena sp. CBHHK59/15]